MKKSVRTFPFFIPAIAISLTFSGCATIMSGRTQEMTFQSNPDGATVSVDGRIIGKTPVTIQLEKKAIVLKSQYPVLVFQKDGYKNLAMKMNMDVDGWYWGNILLGGCIGSSTDIITGSANEYAPNQYIVGLTPLGATPIEGRALTPEKDKTREFIIVAYKDILKDLDTGNGQYLSSLLQSLHIPETEQPETIRKIRGLSMAYPNILQFADHVVELSINDPLLGTAAPASNKAEMSQVQTKADIEPFSNSKQAKVFFRRLNKGTIIAMKLRHGDEITLEFISYDDYRQQVWVRTPGKNFLHDYAIDPNDILDARVVQDKL